MKTNLKKIFNAILAWGQESDRLFKEYHNPRTPVEMFKDFVADSYSCTYNGADFEKRYSENEFRDMFYTAILYDEELPEYVQERVLAMSKEFVDKKVDTDFYNTAVSEIKAEIKDFMLRETVKDFCRKKNDIETLAVRQLVFGHQHNFKASLYVHPLITWAENNNRLDYSFIYRMFEYGYIMGKRAERQKRAGKE